MATLQDRFISFLRFLERYTKTDMVYLASGSFWLLLGQAASILLSLATAIAFGHFASQDTYGNYKYILSLAGLFSAFSLAGIGTAVTQAVAKGYDGALPQGFALNLKWSWGIVVLSFGAAAYYYFFQHSTFLALSLVIVGILSPLLNSFSLFTSFLTGKQQFAHNTVYSFLNALIPVAAVIATLFLTHRAIYIIIVYFAANAIADGVAYLVSLREMRNASADPELFSYSGHLSIMGIVSAIADKIDSIAVFTFLGPAPLAIYSFATAIPEQIKTGVNMLSTLSLPRFATRSLKEIRSTIWARIATLAVLLAIAIALYIAVAPWLFHWLFPLYESSVPLSRWYAISILAAAVTTPLLAVFQAHKQTRVLYGTTISTSLILIISTVVGTYYFGLIGAIGAQIIYRASNALITGGAMLFIRE